MLGRLCAVVCLSALLCCYALPASAGGMRCGKKLVREGQHTTEVQAACGKPTTAVQRVVTLTGFVIDEWSYDFGPNEFVQHLRFENDLLVEVRSGEYGASR